MARGFVHYWDGVDSVVSKWGPEGSRRCPALAKFGLDSTAFGGRTLGSEVSPKCTGFDQFESESAELWPESTEFRNRCNLG